MVNPNVYAVTEVYRKITGLSEVKKEGARKNGREKKKKILPVMFFLSTSWFIKCSNPVLALGLLSAGLNCCKRYCWSYQYTGVFSIKLSNLNARWRMQWTTMPINSAEQIILEYMLHSSKGVGKGREASPLSQPRWEKVDQKAVLERCQQQEPSLPRQAWESLLWPNAFPITTCLHYHAETQWSHEKLLVCT